MLRARPTRSGAGSSPSSTRAICWASPGSEARQVWTAAPRASSPAVRHASRACARRSPSTIRPRKRGRTNRSAAAAAPTSRWSATSTSACASRSTGPTRRSPNVMSTTASPDAVVTAHPVCRRRRGSSACSMQAAGSRLATARRTAAASASSHQISRSLASSAVTQSSTAPTGPCHAHRWSPRTSGSAATTSARWNSARTAVIMFVRLGQGAMTLRDQRANLTQACVALEVDW